MTVLSYVVPAALVLALSWAAVKLTRMPIGTPSIAAVTAVVVFALIAITPLCGLMFDCGCDWPWSGLYHHCNFFDALAKLKCPWCNNVAADALSMLAVFGASVFAAYRAASVSSERQPTLHHRRARRRRDLPSRVAGNRRACRSRHGISVPVHGLSAKAGVLSIAPAHGLGNLRAFRLAPFLRQQVSGKPDLIVPDTGAPCE